MNEALLLHLVSQLETTIVAIRKEIGRTSRQDTFNIPPLALRQIRISGRKPRSDKGKPRVKRLKRKVKQAAK